MMRLFAIILSVAGCLCARANLQNPQSYWGMCDASAGVALDNDHFAVADDEANVLRVYKKGEPLPVHEFDVGRFLGVGKKSEADLEGAARIGERIYWIGSHGRNREGQPAPHRQRFFATQIIGKHGRKLEPVGKPYASLLKDLLADTRFKEFGLAEASLLSPKEHGGLNIEGMCARNDGSVLIAFRAPVPRGMGLIVPLLNPDKIIHGEHAKFGEMFALDLGGFGVRDISQAGDGFLVLAGGHGGGSKTFHLYWWDGKNSKPTLVSDEIFRKLNPEALFQFPNDPPNIFQILSDDGSRKTGGRECKDFPKDQRNFRAGQIEVDLPAR